MLCPNWKQTSKEILLSWLLLFLLFSSWRIWYCLENNTVSLVNRQKVFHAHLNWKFFFFNILKQFCFDILKIKTFWDGKPKTKLPFKYSTLSFMRKFIEDPLARCKVENLWYPEHDKMLYARVVVPLKGILKWWKFF